MFDMDLAHLYGVPTKTLNQAVGRNPRRFPSDFMFRLTPAEAALLKSQIGTSNAGRGGRRRSTPRAFTEQGVAMLSGVLRSSAAIAVNIEIMRAFARLRRLYGEHAELTKRIDELETKFDQRFQVVFDAIRAMQTPPIGRRQPLGFRPHQR
jgi:ORF6N domain-containing protein